MMCPEFTHRPSPPPHKLSQVHGRGERGGARALEEGEGAAESTVALK